MKTIKKYWMHIVAAVGALFGIFWLVANTFRKNKLEKNSEKIKENETQISKLEGKSEEVETQRVKVKTEIEDIKKDIKKTEEVKKKKPGRPKRSTSDAKQNVLNKTKRGKK
jgi:septal ring factor EnvC (AmiA/AmiB activator)